MGQWADFHLFRRDRLADMIAVLFSEDEQGLSHLSDRVSSCLHFSLSTTSLRRNQLDVQDNFTSDSTVNRSEPDDD